MRVPPMAMNNFNKVIIILLFNWPLAENKLAGEKKAPRRRDILTGLYPDFSSDFNIYTGIEPTARVGPVPGLYHRVNETSGRLLISGINLVSGTDLSSGVNMIPEIPLNSGAGSSTETNTSILLTTTTDDARSVTTVTSIPDEVSEVSSLISSSSIYSLNSNLTRDGVNTSRTDLPLFISKSSGNSHLYDHASLTGPLPSSDASPPFGHRLFSRAEIKDQKGFSMPINNNGGGINSEISQSIRAKFPSETGFSAGAEPEFRVVSSINEYSSGWDQFYGINGTGIISVPASDSKNDFFVGNKTNVPSETVSPEASLSSRGALHSINDFSSGASYLPYIDQYIGSIPSPGTAVTSEVDVEKQVVTSPQHFSNQVDRPPFISTSQTIVSVPRDRPAPFPLPVAVPISQLAAVPLGSPSSVSVPTSVPVQIPVPVINTILVPTGAASIGGADSGVPLQSHHNSVSGSGTSLS